VGGDGKTSTTTTSEGRLRGRRRIVMDAEDQRMRIAMAIYDTPQKHTNGFGVGVCLITMEEDEAEDNGGMPLLISSNNTDDEQLICTTEPRFISSAYEIRVRISDGRILPIARLNGPFHVSSSNGVLEFMLDEYSAPTLTGGVRGASRLYLRHEETDAELEIDLTRLFRSGGSTTTTTASEGIGTERFGSPDYCEETWTPDYDEDDDRMGDNEESGGQQSYTYDQSEHIADNDMNDYDDDDDEDEFDDDGFLVDDNHINDADARFSSDDDDQNDTCTVCHDGGELMICDGGDILSGCGESYHVACVHRDEIPEGDWVCSKCANANGYPVTGMGGHEFVTDMREGCLDSGGGGSDDNDFVGVSNNKSRKKGNRP